MRSSIRWSSFSRCALAGTLLVGLLLPGTPAAAASGQLSDPAGDPVDADTGDKVAEPRADITGASVEYAKDRVIFRLQVSQPTDPKTDPGWPQEASTAAWGIDVDNDQQPDYLAALYIVDQQGQPEGEVASLREDKPSCDANVRFNGAQGYEIDFDPACIGSPASFSWGAVMSYDTDPQGGEKPVALDVVPDGDALAGPVSAG
jgi:hypothetical protein